MTNDWKTRAALSGAFQKKQDRLEAKPGVLGDEKTGDVWIDGRPNYVYVRMIGQPIAEVYNKRVPPLLDLPVMVGYDPYEPNLWQVLGIRSLNRYGEDDDTLQYSTGHHAETHRYMGSGPGGGEDILWVEGRQVLPWRITPAGTLTISIYRNTAYIGGVMQSIYDESVDLSAYQPSTEGKACLVLITVDSSGAITETAGADVDIEDLAFSDAPAIPAGTEYVLGAVRLYYGQTVIRESRVVTDVYQARWPMWHRHGAQSTPGIGAASNEFDLWQSMHTLGLPIGG